MTSWPSRLTSSKIIARDTLAAVFSKPSDFTFKPGQTISLILPQVTPNAAPLKHTFSLVSAPHEESLCIATRIRGSAYKQALAKLQPGTELTLAGPYGRFGLPDDTGRTLVLIAGGIGITPYISMLRSATHGGSTQRFVLLYSNRQPEDAAFLEELQELTRLNPYFRMHASITGQTQGNWAGLRGRIDATLLKNTLEPLSEPICYITGTAAMVDDMHDLLTGLGLEEASIRSETFGGY